MNQDKTSILADFVNKNKSTILFWIVIILLLPFILFFISFDFHDLNTISNFGSLGSYLSGTTGFIAAIMTSISVIVLYYTLRITTKYNERQIKHNQTQTIITSFNLLLDSAIKITESIKPQEEPTITYDSSRLFSRIPTDINNHVQWINVMMSDPTTTRFPSELDYLLSFISGEAEKRKIKIKTETDLKNLLVNFFKEESWYNSLENLALLIYGMCDIISKLERNDTLHSTLLILLKSNFHNDVIFYSLIYQNKHSDLSFDIHCFCMIPDGISHFIDD